MSCASTPPLISRSLLASPHSSLPAPCSRVLLALPPPCLLARVLALRLCVSSGDDTLLQSCRCNRARPSCHAKMPSDDDLMPQTKICGIRKRYDGRIASEMADVTSSPWWPSVSGCAARPVLPSGGTKTKIRLRSALHIIISECPVEPD